MPIIVMCELGCDIVLEIQTGCEFIGEGTGRAPRRQARLEAMT